MDDPLRRSSYKVECQIAGLYVERSRLSSDKMALAKLAQVGAEQSEPNLAIRDPYVYEFLGLRPQEILPGIRA
ncbi:MAG: hypothetical protein EPO21_03785 [Chloroflexota bacterium]|nr:MAG: hypothetical protein EPO21_03785 [Chloroflexota bacterium]